MKALVLFGRNERAAGGHRPADERGGGAAPTLDVIYSNELFGRRRELLIEHAGFLYRLRITQNDK